MPGTVNEKKKLREAALWVFLSFGMNCMLSISTYTPGRSKSGIAVFLIIADGILLSLLFDHASFQISVDSDPWKKKVSWLCRFLAGYVSFFFLYQTAFSLPAGVDEIHRCWVQIKQEEDFIKEEAGKGEEDVTIYTVLTSNSHAAVYQLTYVNISRYDTWPNESMAKYYGVRRIYGVDVNSIEGKETSILY